MANGKVQIDVKLLTEKATAGINKLKGAFNSLGSSGKKAGSIFKSVLGANLVSNALLGGIRSVKSGIGGMVSELNNSTKAWKTFEGNMQMLGKSPAEINSAKKAMQDFASKTVYSASEMAQTYSQLAAVGIKETDKLVTGFGGLAAAAENPQQAMKTLSQQATQMAAKPTVAWQDFKLMLDQTPAGISAIAREMGMTTQELVKNVQDGKIKTEEFFDAIKKVGNSEHLAKMATEFKTVGQAIDGAKESLAVKLMPAFEKLNKFGIKAITALSDALDKLDFESFANKLGDFLDGIDIESFISSLSTAVSNAYKIFQSFLPVIKVVGNTLMWLISVLGKVVSSIGNFLGSLSPGTLKIMTNSLLALYGAFKLFKIVKSFNGFDIFKSKGKIAFDTVKNSATKSKGVISQVFSGLSRVIRTVGTSIATAAKGIGTGLATAFRGLGMAIAMVPPATWIALGAGIAIVCAGLALLATQSEGVSEILHALGNVISQIITTLTEAMVTLIPLIIEGITKIVEVITKGITTVFPLVINAFTTIGNVIIGVMNSIGAIIESVGLAIKSVFEGIAIVIESVGNSIKSVLEGLGAAFTGFGNGVRLALEGVSSVIESVGNAIKSALQGVASVVESVGTAIKSSFEGIATIIESVGTSIKTVLEGIGSAFESFGKAVKSVCDGVKEVVEAIGDAIKSVLEGVADVFKAIGQAALDAGNGFKLFAEGVQILVNMNLADLVATLVGVGDAIGKITDKASFLVTLGDGMYDFGYGLKLIADSGSQATTALQTLPGIIDNFKNSISGLPAELTTVATAFITFVNQTVTSLAGLTMANVSISLFNSLVRSMGMALIAVSATVGAFSNSLNVLCSGVSNATNSFNSLNAVISAIQVTLNSVQNVLSSVAFQAISTANNINQIGLTASNVASIIARMGSTVSSTFSSISSSISSAMSSASNVIRTACNSIVQTLTETSNRMKQEGTRAGQECARAIANGLNAAKGSIINAMNGIKSSIENVGRATASSARYIGAMISQGVASGIWSAVGSVRAAANAIIAEVQRAMQAKAQIHSPSRLMAKKVGKYLPQGVALGIEKESDVVAESLSFIDDLVKATRIKAEKVLSFSRGGSIATSSNSVQNNNSTTNNNYDSLLKIEKFENHSKEDVRKLFEQIKFLTREEKDRL